MTTLISGLGDFPIPMGIPTGMIALWASRNKTATVEEPVEAQPIPAEETQATKFETATVAAVAIDGEQNDLLDALTRDASDQEAKQASSGRTPPPFFKKTVNRAKNNHRK